MRKLPLLWLTAMAIIGFSLGLIFWSRTPSSPSLKVVSEAEPIFVALEKEIPKKFSDYEVRRTGWTGQRTAGSPVKVPGYAFTISSEAIPGLWIHPKRVNDELKETSQSVDDVWGLVHQKLVVAGFRESSSESYIRDKETCTIKHELGTKLLELRCTSPKFERALAEQAKPFVGAYLASHRTTESDDLVFGPLVIRSQNPNGPITASKMAGYDLAEAVIGHSGASTIALYYSYQGVWHYVTEATDEFGFSCSAIMKNPDARKAYRHQWCYQRENDGGLRVLDGDGTQDCGRIACDEDGQQQR